MLIGTSNDGHVQHLDKGVAALLVKNEKEPFVGVIKEEFLCRFSIGGSCSCYD